LQQRGIPAVAGGVALIVFQSPLDPLPGVLGDQRRHRDLEPIAAGPVDDRVAGGRGAPGEAGGAVEPGALIGAHRLAEASQPGVGGVAQHAPDGGAVPARLAGAGRHAQPAQPAGQLADRDPTVGVAGEQLGDDRRLVRHDLVAGLGMLALADIPVAERGAREHVDRAALGAVGFTAAGPFQDLGALVLGDHALELMSRSRITTAPGGESQWSTGRTPSIKKR